MSTKRPMIRFNADASIRADVEAIHQQVSSQATAGETYEALLRIALELVQDPSSAPSIPPEAVALRKRLGLATDSLAVEVAETLGGMLKEIHAANTNQGRLISAVEKLAGVKK